MKLVGLGRLSHVSHLRQNLEWWKPKCLCINL